MRTRPPIDPERAFAFYVSDPGRASQVARNGWPCAAVPCRRKPTVEVGWAERCRGPVGYANVVTGMCKPCAGRFAALYVLDPVPPEAR